MARLARVVAAGIPHHVTQRGNRRQQVFFSDDDYAVYRELLAEGCRAAGVAVWGYCLMPNHVHLILTPSDEDGLRAALGEAHRRYTRHVNLREGWRGYLWQGRFASCPMDEAYLLACARYVEFDGTFGATGTKRRDRYCVPRIQSMISMRLSTRSDTAKPRAPSSSFARADKVPLTQNSNRPLKPGAA